MSESKRSAPSELDVKFIVAAWLRQHRFDGLGNEHHECGCGLGDLMPCFEYCGDCTPAYDHGPKNGYDHWYSPEKPADQKKGAG